MKDSTPIIFIIFGITENPALGKVLPALMSLYTSKMLPPKFAIIGFSPLYVNREDLRQIIRDNIGKNPGQFREEDIKHFLDHIYYEQGYFDKQESYTSLARRVESLCDGFRQETNRLFHVSLNEVNYNSIIDGINSNGMIKGDGEAHWTRVLIDKPFGSDLSSAKIINKKLLSIFSEDQIFRADHYLAKEGVQNLSLFRFSNHLFESVWDRKGIDKVHIKLFEKKGVESDGGYFDKVGALRDMCQSHAIQILALLTMNKPRSFEAKMVLAEKTKALRSLRPFTKKTVSSHVVRGQYEGYKNESGAREHTQTETFFRIEAYIDNSRWKNVPFYLESGKCLAESVTEIDVYFNNDNGDTDNKQNILTFRIQPEEGVRLRFWTKTPGLDMNVEPKNLKFKYLDSWPGIKTQNSYVKVMADAMHGDKSIFLSIDEILSSWKFIDSIICNWNSVPLTIYKKGSEYVI